MGLLCTAVITRFIHDFDIWLGWVFQLLEDDAAPAGARRQALAVIRLIDRRMLARLWHRKMFLCAFYELFLPPPPPHPKKKTFVDVHNDDE